MVVTAGKAVEEGKIEVFREESRQLWLAREGAGKILHFCSRRDRAPTGPAGEVVAEAAARGKLPGGRSEAGVRVMFAS